MDAATPLENMSRPFYPPSITPPPKPLGLLSFLRRFTRNPLEGIPEPAYHQPLVAHATPAMNYVWVTGPSMIEDILLRQQADFPKPPLERKVFGGLLGNGLLTAQGDDWRWQRQVVAPLFRHGELLRYVPQMSAAAEQTVAVWRRRNERGPWMIDKDMGHVAFDIITRTLLPEGADYVGEIMEQAADDWLSPISWPIAYGIMGLPDWLPHPGRSRMRRAEKALRSNIRDLVRTRRVEPASRDDLFAKLAEARHPETGAPMDDELLVDTLITFLTAGHETTAKALTWALYLTACSPEWEARMVEEIAKVASDRPIAGEDIDKLQIVGQVLKEAMRLYPPAPVLTRIAARDVQIGAHFLKAGTFVVIPIFAVHRHRQLWDDPDRFDPDRFAPEREAKIYRTQFMPFGAGRRVCVGGAFAMIEAKTLLATFVRAARFRHADGHVPTPVSRVTLRPKGGMPMHVTVR